MPNHLDGNALAGVLSEVFTTDVTAARARCGSCGRTSPLAEAMVYPDAPGLVARCASCNHILAVVVTAGEHLILSLAGLDTIELRATGSTDG
ncbi:DUF6510 family protein [Promicromonospora sp. NPDC090134]|uniref:DUF6510 family protein n=1 Tax=Promicromonospora sp. NPDC090134 TaxID=3364408 RepID=UPI00381FC067